jgi:hypothetical protein
VDLHGPVARSPVGWPSNEPTVRSARSIVARSMPCQSEPAKRTRADRVAGKPRRLDDELVEGGRCGRGEQQRRGGEAAKVHGATDVPARRVAGALDLGPIRRREAATEHAQGRVTQTGRRRPRGSEPERRSERRPAEAHVLQQPAVGMSTAKCR